MAAILDFRSCDIWEHFYVHRWIDHTPKHGIRHQHQLSRLNNTKVMRVFNFGYFGWRPYWIWPKKVPSRFFPPGILIDLVNRPPKENNYVGFKTIPIFSRSNSIFMRLLGNFGHVGFEYMLPDCIWVLSGYMNHIELSVLVSVVSLRWGKKWPDILQMAFSNSFLWMKIVEFWCKFHWN